jgi:hypothetical protein
VSNPVSKIFCEIYSPEIAETLYWKHVQPVNILFSRNYIRNFGTVKCSDMLEQTLGILFYQKKPKGYSKGNVPLYMRITVNGVRIEIGTKQACEPERWNTQAQRAKGTNEASRSLNSFLDTLERQVHNARRTVIEAQTPITAGALKNVLTGQSERPHMLLEIFAQHNIQLLALVGREFAPATGTV